MGTAQLSPEAKPSDPAMLGGQMFDLVIVGGGITGAALAYAAAHARDPLRVALIERGQLASGTSSRSSGLLHGGLRYLAQGRLSLVRQLMRGRGAFSRLAPHLVQRAPFVLPIGAGGGHSPWLMRLALGIYGWCDHQRAAGAQALLRPRRLGPLSARKYEPMLGSLSAGGAFCYDELTVNAAGLVQELAAGAEAAGVVIATGIHCQGLHISGERVRGVWARSWDASSAVSETDRGGAAVVRIDARVVVDATGPWSGQLERFLGTPHDVARRPTLRLSRGSHLVLPAARLPLTSSVVFFAADGRALFASPRDGSVLVGTTEREHAGSPDDVRPSAEEVAYLMTAIAGAFPDARLRPSDVVRTFAGVRPLAPAGGADGRDLGSLDRGYVLDWPAPGLLAMRGGKLTLALSAAGAALRAIDRRTSSLGFGRARVRYKDLLPPLLVPAAMSPVSVPVSRRPSAARASWRTA